MKDYTIVIVSYEQCSCFVAYVTANSVEQAEEVAIDLGEATTGIQYGSLYCTEGIHPNLIPDMKTMDWR